MSFIGLGIGAALLTPISTTVSTDATPPAFLIGGAVPYPPPPPLRWENALLEAKHRVLQSRFTGISTRANDLRRQADRDLSSLGDALVDNDPWRRARASVTRVLKARQEMGAQYRETFDLAASHRSLASPSDLL